MKKCNSCGEESVIEEFENGRKVNVCTECGVLQNDVQDYVTENFIEGSSLSDGLGRGPKGAKRGCHRVGPKEGKVFGATHIARMGKALGMNTDMISEATDVYNRVFDSGELNRTSKDSKLAMCGACIYTVGRNRGNGLGLKNVAKVLDVRQRPAKKLAKALKILKTKFSVEAQAVPAATEVDYLLDQGGFSSEVKKLTHNIMSMCDRYWLSQGRLTSITAAVAIYYAWKACNFPKEKLEFAPFCKKYKINITDMLRNRKNEVEKMLLTAVKEIPWLQGHTIKASCIYAYVKDVVSFQGSLMQGTLDSAADSVETSAQNGASQDCDKMQCDKDYGTYFRKDTKCYKKKSTQAEESARRPKKIRQHKVGEDGDNDDGSDFDLGSDDDTDRYIRSAEEVSSIQNLQD